MSSFAYQGTTCVVMGAEGGLGAGEEARKGLIGKKALNSQHGTGVKGSSHPCTVGYNPKKGLLFFTYCYTHVNYSLYSTYHNYPLCY
jgi:hypothetical protein